MRKSVGAYFTVEAAMVLPVVLGSVLLVIHLLFFQYNRCLMEQDMGVLALRGAALQTEDNEERVRQIRNDGKELYYKKYIMWGNKEMELKQEKGKFCVRRSGQLEFPFFPQVSETAVYKNHVISEVFFIRNYRKLIGG